MCRKILGDEHVFNVKIIIVGFKRIRPKNFTKTNVVTDGKYLMANKVEL